jgi:hypothetical protein
MKAAAQVLFAVWAAILTTLFFMTQTPYLFADAAAKHATVGVLAEARKALLPQLTATFRQ